MSTLPGKALFSQSPTWVTIIFFSHVGDCENSALFGRVDIWEYLGIKPISPPNVFFNFIFDLNMVQFPCGILHPTLE